MQWIIFGILAMVVITGVRRMVREAPDISAKKPASPFAPAQEKPSKQVEIHDTVQCSVCNAFMVKSAPSCGREGCPFGN